jgi:hypothetical protein
MLDSNFTQQYNVHDNYAFYIISRVILQNVKDHESIY